MIKVIREISELNNLKDEWNRLWKISTEATPFQKFEYVRLSLEYFESEGSSLYIMTITDNNKGNVIAIFPTVLEKSGKLRFVNYAHSDFCSAIIDPEYCNYNLFEEISSYIKSDKEIKVVEFTNLKSDNSLIAVFKPFIRTCFVHDICYYSEIPIQLSEKDTSFLDGFRYINGKRKKKLKKLHASMENDCDFHIYNKINNDIYPEQAIQYLTELMVKNGIREKSYFSESMLNFWRELYEKNILIVALLSKNGVAMSCNFMYFDEKCNEYIKWIMLYSMNDYNLSVNVEIANHIYTHGGGVINFARGIYGYKMENFHPDVKVLYRVVITKSLWSDLKALLCVQYYYIKEIAKKYIRK